MHEVPGNIDGSQVDIIFSGKIYTALVEWRQLKTTTDRNDLYTGKQQ